MELITRSRDDTTRVYDAWRKMQKFPMNETKTEKREMRIESVVRYILISCARSCARYLSRKREKGEKLIIYRNANPPETLRYPSLELHPF